MGPSSSLRSVGVVLLAIARCASTLAPQKKKVLALHGKGGSGAAFRAELAPLVEAVDADFFFPDAPLDGSAWWTQLPAGARSYDAEKFEGVQESMASLIECADGRPFDAVVGHSQGAMFGAVLMCHRRLRHGRSRKILSGDAVGIFSGAASPSPYAKLFEQCLDVRRPPPRTLHYVGLLDDVNPPDSCRKLYDAFKPSALLVEHGRGHVMPLDDPGVVEAMAQLILEEPPEYAKPQETPSLTPSLNGVKLATILTKLVETLGWETLGEKVPINCFLKDPSIKSSLTFLRKTEHDWARKRVEALYLDAGAGTDKVLPDSGSEDDK